MAVEPVGDRPGRVGEAPEVARWHPADRASVYHRSWWDALRVAWQGLNPRGRLGGRVTTKAHVTIRLAGNARLIIGDCCTIDSHVHLPLTKPEPTVVLRRHVGIGWHTIVSAK